MRSLLSCEAQLCLLLVLIDDKASLKVKNLYVDDVGPRPNWPQINKMTKYGIFHDFLNFEVILCKEL